MEEQEWRARSDQARALACAAAERIMAFYGDTAAARKADGSPLTRADEEAHELIVTGLRVHFPDDGILSEEGADPTRLRARLVWIIDPLDGTKEFLKQNGEFTVNIALVEEGTPVLGVIVLPASNECYYATPEGAFWEHGGPGWSPAPIHVSQRARFEEMTLVVSRSHQTPEDERLSQAAGFARVISAGSSLKGCLVARGEADVYLRTGPTNEWDICAMDAILRAAGGQFTTLTGEPFKYNRADPRVNGFLASNGRRHGELLQLVHAPTRHA